VDADNKDIIHQYIAISLLITTFTTKSCIYKPLM